MAVHFCPKGSANAVHTTPCPPPTTTTPTPLTGDLSTGQLKARELSIPCNEVRHADAGSPHKSQTVFWTFWTIAVFGGLLCWGQKTPNGVLDASTLMTSSKIQIVEVFARLRCICVAPAPSAWHARPHARPSPSAAEQQREQALDATKSVHAPRCRPRP